MISDKTLEKLEALAWSDLKKFATSVKYHGLKVISKVPVEELKRKKFVPVYYRVILQDVHKNFGVVFVPVAGKATLEALS